ncbi:MAG: ANTAR domain-containing protein [Thermoguttaceae bacterium]|nr:ANTAR domain-containing protein [Thermoguttaceae bacterium]
MDQTIAYCLLPTASSTMSTIFIASQNAQLTDRLTVLLLEAGHEVLGVSASGNETIRRCRQLVPDLIVLSQRLQDMSGLATAEILQDVSQIIVLLDRAGMESAPKSTGSVYLEMPISPELLLHTITVLSQVQTKVHRLSNRILSLESMLKESKTILRAKEKLMAMYQTDENEAHAFLRKVAMNNHVKLAEAAQIVLDQLQE